MHLIHLQLLEAKIPFSSRFYGQPARKDAAQGLGLLQIVSFHIGLLASHFQTIEFGCFTQRMASSGNPPRATVFPLPRRGKKPQPRGSCGAVLKLAVPDAEPLKCIKICLRVPGLGNGRVRSIQTLPTPFTGCNVVKFALAYRERTFS